jgi:alpha-galactosidase
MRALPALMLLLLAVPAAAQTPALDPNRTPPHLEPGRTANGLALTPPMGWNSWNRFACDVNESTVRAVAAAMVSSGMRDAG